MTRWGGSAEVFDERRWTGGNYWLPRCLTRALLVLQPAPGIICQGRRRGTARCPRIRSLLGRQRSGFDKRGEGRAVDEYKRVDRREGQYTPGSIKIELSDHDTNPVRPVREPACPPVRFTALDTSTF